MAETRSRLYALKPIIERWPAIRKPEGHVSFRTKLGWTTGALLLYFALANITLFGVAQTRRAKAAVSSIHCSSMSSSSSKLTSRK